MRRRSTILLIPFSYVRIDGGANELSADLLLGGLVGAMTSRCSATAAALRVRAGSRRFASCVEYASARCLARICRIVIGAGEAAPRIAAAQGLLARQARGRVAAIRLRSV